MHISCRNELMNCRQRLRSEKNCKNVAYYFILSNGLLWQFKSSCSRYRGNAYQDCWEYIRIMASQYMNPCGADAETGA